MINERRILAVPGSLDHRCRGEGVIDGLRINVLDNICKHDQKIGCEILLTKYAQMQ